MVVNTLFFTETSDPVQAWTFPTTWVCIEVMTAMKLDLSLSGWIQLFYLTHDCATLCVQLYALPDLMS